MILTKLLRTIKYGLLRFWREGLLSTATVAIVFLVLVGFGGLILFNTLSNKTLSYIQDKVDISVYFKPDANEDEIIKMQKSLQQMAEVKSVEYVSKDRALEIFKERNANDKKISQALVVVDTNPFGAYLNIKARDLKDYATINAYLEKDTFKNEIDKISYTESAAMIERLKKIKTTVEQGAFIIFVFIVTIAALIIFNTIKLAIYSNRDEIGIMRLVGASNYFIRGPFLVEGILYGVLGGIMATLVIGGGIYYLSPYMKIFVPDLNGWDYFVSNFFKFLTYEVLFGVLLGVVSSYIAVRKYLKI